MATTDVDQQLQAMMDAMEAASLGLEDLAEMQRTQPAIHGALMDYATAIRAGDQGAAFRHAADIAAHVLALAAGLKI